MIDNSFAKDLIIKAFYRIAMIGTHVASIGINPSVKGANSGQEKTSKIHQKACSEIHCQQ